jgi:lipopolysaccharide transport system ATP-binding protein|tara:strand:- start:1189 stop:2463 length:1275 start_codon:yes stop_codon:yes gene_type:complete
MNETVINTTNISKRYVIGNKNSKPNTLAGEIINFLNTPIRNFKKLRSLTNNKNNTTTIWALKNINVQIKEKEIIGIIGSNGSGKSTLLKILSKITTPTSGEAFIKGKVGSLLEVGTGFHDELTGRENIYLNGTILGMNKKQINNNIDNIINFSGVKEFIDTPVKRYSSGMRVRLAFSVAAYLEPEILIIDEVLAVGDASFQKKCLGKMDDVAKSGRTVLFVSHNMEAIMSLCTRVIWIDKGEIIRDGNPTSVVNEYLETTSTLSNTNINLEKMSQRGGDGSIKFTNLKIMNSKMIEKSQFNVGEKLNLLISLKSIETGLINSNLAIKVIIKNQNNSNVLNFNNESAGKQINLLEGINNILFTIPKLPLGQGIYSISLEAWANGGKSDTVGNICVFETIPGDFNGLGIPNLDHTLFYANSIWEQE